jgi:hypothetical protein
MRLSGSSPLLHTLMPLGLNGSPRLGLTTKLLLLIAVRAAIDELGVIRPGLVRFAEGLATTSTPANSLNVTG